MLHMVVNTHTAESCPYRAPENSQAMTGVMERLGALAKEYEAEVKGAWGNTAAHRMFALIEAPNAHVVNELVEATGLIARGTTEVYAVRPLATIQKGLEEMAATAH